MSEATIPDGALYITALRVRDLKGIKQAELELKAEGGLIILSGPNGAGKTSLSDAIAWTLGGDRDIEAMPVRAGAESAETFVRLEGPGYRHPYEVTKRILGRDKIRLTVRVAGRKGVEQAPQAILSSFIGDLTFDPSEFRVMAGADQRAVFEKIVHLPTSLTELEKKETGLFRARHDAKVLLDRLEAQVQGIEKVPEDAPTEQADVSKLVEDLSAAQMANHRNAERQRLISHLRTEVAEREGKISEAVEEIARLQKEIATLRSRVDSWQELNREDEAAIVQRQAEVDVAVDVDLKPIQEAISRCAAVNQEYERARAIEQRNATKVRERDAQLQAWESLDGQIQELRRSRREMLARAEIPVAGLSVDDEGVVTYNGVPLSQCSDGEAIDVGMAVGMALNPKLRLIRVKNASLLDEESRVRVAQRAIDRGYLVLMEVAAAPGKGTGFVIEEGEIVSRPGGENDGQA